MGLPSIGRMMVRWISWATGWNAASRRARCSIAATFASRLLARAEAAASRRACKALVNDDIFILLANASGMRRIRGECRDWCDLVSFYRPVR